MVVISSMIYIFFPFYLIPSDVFFFVRIFSKPLKTAVYIKDLRTIKPSCFSSLKPLRAEKFVLDQRKSCTINIWISLRLWLFLFCSSACDSVHESGGPATILHS